MAYELNEGRGSLFRNDKKTAAKHPDMRGEVKINGVVYAISAWTEVSDKGTKWLSLSVQPKQERASVPQANPLDSDLPF